MIWAWTTWVTPFARTYTQDLFRLDFERSSPKVLMAIYC